MIKILFSLFVAAAGPASAFDLPKMGAAAVMEIVPAAAVPAAPAALKTGSQSVWMSVSNNAAAKEAQANDWSRQIEARVRDTGNGRFDVNLRTDQGYSWASITRYGSNYNLYGAGLNLNMSGDNGRYFINGSLIENGKTAFVSANVSGSDAFSGNIFGNGLNLFISRGSINGWFEEERLPKKALAGVAAFIMALQLEAAQPAK